MKRILLLILSLIAGIILLKWVIGFVGWNEIKGALMVFKGWEGILIFILTLLIILTANWRWREILKGQDVNISFWDLFSPYLAGFAVMFLAPVLVWGGEVFRAYAVKRKSSLSWSKALASVVIDRVLEWTVNLVIILAGLTFFLSRMGLPPKNLLITFGGVFLLFSAAISWFYFKTFRRESITKTFRRLFGGSLSEEPLLIEKEIFDFFRFENKPMVKSFLISFLRAAVMYLRTWLLIAFLVKEISPISAVSILSFTYLAAMIPIPTSLGSHEAIQAFAFKSLGMGVPAATAFTMIIRAAELLFSLAGLVVIMRYGVIFFKKIILDKVDKSSI